MREKVVDDKSGMRFGGEEKKKPGDSFSEMFARYVGKVRVAIAEISALGYCNEGLYWLRMVRFGI